MYLLDTHVWIWAIHNDPRLSAKHKALLLESLGRNIFVSAISCWEIAKLVSLNRIKLDRSISDWFKVALEESQIELVPITPEIAIESNMLPGVFHRDPADAIIVATARKMNLTLLTNDRRIREYEHVQTI